MATTTIAKPSTKSALTTRQLVASEKPSRGLKAPSAVLTASIVCFVLISLITIRHHLSPRVVELSVLFDSASYLNSASAVHECVRSLFAHSLNADSLQRSTKLLADALLLDGPVLPTLGAAYYGLIQATPTVFDMRPALILQSLLHGLGSALIVALGARFTGRLLWGVLASFAWGLYPAAAIGSANFMSETLSVALILSQLLCVSHWVEGDDSSRKRAHRKLWLAGLSGCLSALLLLVKPALSLTLVAAIAAAIVGMRATHHTVACAGKRLLALAFGFVIALAPWLLFTYSATGQPVVMPQRMPVKNLAIGLNLETNGWGSVPETGFASLFNEQDKPLPTMIGLISQKPVEYTTLLTQKLSRLWASPWNDYRQKFLFAATATQVRWHQILIALSLAGILWFILSLGRKSLYWLGSDRKLWLPIGMVSLAVVAGHLAYLPFVATSRYGFTAMPAFLVFALFALVFLTRTTLKTAIFGCASVFTLLVAMSLDSLKTAESMMGPATNPELTLQLGILCQSFVWTLAVLLAVVAYLQTSTISKRGVFAATTIWLLGVGIVGLTVAGTQREWNLTLQPGVSICRALPSVNFSGAPTHALALVDCDQASSASIEVNGHIQPAVLTPLAFMDSSGDLLRNMQLFGGISGAGAEKMRQWRYAEFPVNWVVQGSENVIKFGGDKALKIYGDYIEGSESVMIPGLWQFSPTRLLSDPTASDSRIPAGVATHRVGDRVWTESAGQNGQTGQGQNAQSARATNDNEFKYRAPRVMLALVYGSETTSSSAKKAWTHSESTALTSSSGEPIVVKADIPSSLLYQGTLNLRISAVAQLNAAQTAQSAANRADSAKDALADVHVCLRNKTQMGHDLEFIGAAPMISAGAPVDLTAVLPTSACVQGDHYVELVVRPHGFAMSLKDVRIDLSSKPTPKISNNSRLRVL